MGLVQDLSLFDLTSNEATVYLALLERGRAPAGVLIEATGLHRQLVYMALERLVELNLASVVMRRGRKEFHAASPHELLRRIDERESIARALVPALATLQQQAQDPVDLRILHGSEGYIESLQALIASSVRTDKIIRIIGGAKTHYFWDTIGEFKEEYIRTTRALKVAKHLIGSNSFETERIHEFLASGPNRFWSIPYRHAPPSFIRMTPERVAIELFEPAVLVVEIVNRALAQNFLEQFQMALSTAVEWTLLDSGKLRKGLDSGKLRKGSSRTRASRRVPSATERSPS